MNATLSRASLVLAVASAASVATESAQAGEVFFLGPVPYSYVTDISADGRIAVGNDQVNVWTWTRDSWVTFVEGALPPGNGVGGRPNITEDGLQMTCSTLQGKPLKAEATIYDIKNLTFLESMGSLGYNCDIERSGPWGMSRDGRYVCGLNWDVGCSARGFIHDRDTGAEVRMLSSYFYKPTRANAVSDDGSVVVGWADDYVGWRQGSIWRRNAEGAYVQTLLFRGVATAKVSEASSVSGNGQWVFGRGRDSFDGGAPYRWSVETGYQAMIPAPQSGVGAVADCNVDGSLAIVVFGFSTYLWTPDRGYISLANWSAEQGFKLPSNWAYYGLTMSDDGLHIGGAAVRDDGIWSPFVLDLTPSAPACPADFDNDGEVGAADLSLLLASWDSVNPDVDLDGDKVIGAADLSLLLAAWGACP
jgi:uncharacterized membrane protein